MDNIGGSMKRYEFNIVIKEENDEFWNDMPGTGCDEVQDMVRDVLATAGFYNGDNCAIHLMSFTDEKELM